LNLESKANFTQKAACVKQILNSMDELFGIKLSAIKSLLFLKDLYTYPECAKIGSTRVPEQWASNEPEFKVVIMPSFDPA
jgi:hypothetical protein